MKKYLNLSFVYAILAIVFGVFYREFTKFNGFTQRTSLAFVHGHYFVLGMFFFLILAIIVKVMNIDFGKKIIAYQLGLNISAIMVAIRGVLTITTDNLSKALDASISGIAGIGHIILGISLIMILLQIKKEA